ncbi:MAG: hypothetical protein WCE23_02445 [Candidatus Binatus sp.]
MSKILWGTIAGPIVALLLMLTCPMEASATDAQAVIRALDDPVCCEQLSESNSLIMREKYREFSRFRASRGRLAAEKAWSSLGFFSEFPTQRIREF